MARIERIEKSRKEQKCSKCGEVIPVGSAYLKATPYRRSPIIRCTKCGLKSYETSGSEYVQTCGSLVEDWSSDFGCHDGVAEEIVSQLEDLRDQQQDSLDNIPEQLQEGDTGMMLQERIDCLEDVINELENVSFDDCREEAISEIEAEMGEYDPEDSEYETQEDYQDEFDDKVTELTEQKYSELIDEALSSLEY